MAQPIINGTPRPIAQPMQVDFDPVRGLVVEQSWKGAGADSLVGLANYYIANRIAFKWKRHPVLSTLEATLSGGQGGLPDSAQENYELLGNEIQKSILESGIAMSGSNTFPNLIKDVTLGHAALQAGNDTFEQDLFSGLDPGEKTYYAELLGFLLRGQTHFARGQYVMRHTFSISNFYTGVVLGEDAVERLFSTETLLSSHPFMPPVMSQKISGIPIPGVHDNYAWSWRRLPSRMATTAQNRVEVSTEFWLEEWNIDIYGSVL